MRRVFLLDNYDSFTWNLAAAFRVLGARVRVVRNDAITVAEVWARRPTHLVLSPGPGRPEQAGRCLALLESALGRCPVLGVCLGHQALALLLGGRVVSARSLTHGKPSPITHDQRTIFAGLPSPTPMGRYHSLAVEEASLPAALEVSARADDGEIMGLRHRALPVEGVQFHPESVLSPEGNRLLARFLALDGGAVPWPPPRRALPTVRMRA